GTIMGPIMGPALGGWLTYDYSWRWVFYINLPIGALCTLGSLIFIRQTRNVHREPFDFVGFLSLSLGVGALQLMLDRGELKDGFHSSEIWIEATIAGLGLDLCAVHTATTDDRSFLNRDLLKSANFMAGTTLLFAGGRVMTGPLAAPHPDPGDGDPQPDAQPWWQHRHQHPGCHPGPEHSGGPFAAGRRTAAG